VTGDQLIEERADGGRLACAVAKLGPCAARQRNERMINAMRPCLEPWLAVPRTLVRTGGRQSSRSSNVKSCVRTGSAGCYGELKSVVNGSVMPAQYVALSMSSVRFG
jgi:hypothetical protein